MNTNQVRYFIAVCEQRSFTRAAKACGIRQPSLSDAILHLEREFGGRLFVRAKPIRLAALGVALLPMLSRINDAAEQARRCAADRTASRRSSRKPNAHVQPI